MSDFLGPHGKATVILMKAHFESELPKLKDLKKEKKSLLNDIYDIELRYEKEVIENNKVKLQLKLRVVN